MSIYERVPKDVPSTIVDNSGRKEIFPSPFQNNEINQLRLSVQSCRPLVAEARKLDSYPDGAYGTDWNFARPIDTLLPYGNAARKVSPLLLADALVRAADKDGVGAVQSANALLNMAHYLRDEPILIAQLVRVANRREAITALENAMTCANVPDDALKQLQQSLEAEAATSGLAVALRGERASTDQWARSAAKGDANWGILSVSDDSVAWYLREMNAMIALADKPYSKSLSQWQALENEVIRSSYDIRKIMPAINKVGARLAISDAEMQTAAIAMAAERYRRAKGEWPKEVKQLVPTYLKSEPIDRFTGEPFRMKQVNNGFTVYSVHNRCTGEFTSIGFPDHLGIGFRMIDPNTRK